MLPRAPAALSPILFAALLASVPAVAQVEATFTARQINGGCFVDDQEPFTAGDPERYFRMVIFDSNSPAVLNACAAGCVDDGTPGTLDARSLDFCSFNTGCGIWNFADQTVTKTIQNLSGAYFYFGLFDEDTDADDSLGDHWLFASGPLNQTPFNNNNSPYYADNPITVLCGARDVEGTGDASNYNVTFQVSFQDVSGPVAPSGLTATDDALTPVVWDNDSRLDLGWTPGQDPHSGISRHGLDLSSPADGFIYLNETVSGSGVSLCPSGCTLPFTPVHGRVYSASVGSTNGSFPQIDNVATGYSTTVMIGFDFVNPTTAITLPASGSWQNSSFLVEPFDSDTDSGLDFCERRVISNGTLTQSWTARPCDASATVTVGPGSQCRDEGANTCSVRMRSTDLARLVSSEANGLFSVDFTPDSVSRIDGFEFDGGPGIAEGAWVSDNDPYLEAFFTASAAPFAGHSLAIDAVPDCNIDLPGDDPLSLQLSPQSEGFHTLRVRPIDEAGNCGNVGEFGFGVDTVGDSMAPPTFQTIAGGTPVLDGIWQPDPDVNAFWSTPASTSPIAGYSYAVGAGTDCGIETASNEVDLFGLPDGINTFSIRAIDEAGNCGLPATFDAAVDATRDAVGSLQALTEPGGSTIPPVIWQADNDPFLTWAVPASASPILGYGVAVDQIPGCAVDTAIAEFSFPPDDLADGIHEIQVRALDEAGNCGPPAAFEIWVDSSPATGPGRVTGMTIVPNDGDALQLDLSWAPSCGLEAVDYSVHEGRLGVWYSHTMKLCSTGTALSATIGPEAGDRYFLVVPVSPAFEGSYGTDRFGTERPPSGDACFPQPPPAPCP